MFIGMMLVDAALAAWAVGMMQQPQAPRWIPFILVWLGLTLAASVGLVLLVTNTTVAILSEKDAALIGPFGAGVALVACVAAMTQQRRARKSDPSRPAERTGSGS